MELQPFQHSGQQHSPLQNQGQLQADHCATKVVHSHTVQSHFVCTSQVSCCELHLPKSLLPSYHPSIAPFRSLSLQLSFLSLLCSCSPILFPLSSLYPALAPDSLASCHAETWHGPIQFGVLLRQICLLFSQLTARLASKYICNTAELYSHPPFPQLPPRSRRLALQYRYTNVARHIFFPVKQNNVPPSTMTCIIRTRLDENVPATLLAYNDSALQKHKA